MDLVSWLTLILSTATTFSLFSILTGIDNPWFSWAEHTYVGAATAVLGVTALKYLYDKVILRITASPASNWSLIISLILGLMMLTRIFPSYSYIARIPIAVATGTGIAISTRAIIFSGIIKQVKATILPIFGVADAFTMFTNIMVIIFVFSMITYFVYTTELKGGLKTSHQLGRYLLYAAFGALFAMTYMGRLGLLLGRMESMLIPESHLYVTIVVVAVILATIIILQKNYPETLKKLVPE